MKEFSGKTLMLFVELDKHLAIRSLSKKRMALFGQQVYLIQNENELIELVKKLKHKPFILQEFIENSRGRDIRINVVGDKVIAAMKRTSEHDFRANMTNGGQSSALHTN